MIQPDNRMFTLGVALLLALVSVSCAPADPETMEPDPPRPMVSRDTPSGTMDVASADAVELAEVPTIESAANLPGKVYGSGSEPMGVASMARYEGDVTVATLDNGLTVIVKPFRIAPVVTVKAYVNTGGMYEQEWLGCGISHLVEHLVAKGAVHDMGAGATAKSAQQTTGRVQEIGGQSNAYTSLDVTAYYISASATKTDDCIDLVADWMARPSITEEDFQREHGVVQRELEMGKDDPGRQMWYTHAANAFAGHPAGVPVIGYARPLSQLTYEDVLAYHKRMYVPQNMVFVVVGDVDPKKVIARTQRAFAGFKTGRSVKHNLPDVEPIAGVRRVTREHPAMKDVSEYIAFRSIPLVHEDLYALDVLSFILSRGQSARLPKTVQREKKLVTSVDTSSWTPDWGDGNFTVSFRCDPDKVDEAEKAIFAELKRVIDEGVDENELARAKKQKIASWVYSQQTADSIASTLGSDYQSTRDVLFSKHYAQRIQKVTAKQVREMARKYFTFDRMAITRMVPPGTEAAVEAGRTDKAQQSQADVLKLDNGLTVVLQPTDAVGLVSMCLATKGGLLLENDKTNGLGNLMASLTTRGAGKRSAEEIDDFFANAGGGLAGNCGNNTFYWQATVLADSAEPAMEIFADVVLDPTFPAEELEIMRPRVLAAIARADAHWSGELQRTFRSKFFADSPFAMQSIGQADVVSKATPKQLAKWHAKNIRAGSSVLVVYGNFDTAAARKLLTKRFGKMPAGKVDLPEVAPRKVTEAELHVKKTDKQTVGVMMARPSMEVTNLDDRLPLNVLDTIISGYRLPSGWLHTELRGKQLVYVVHAYNWSGLVPGAFIAYANCQPDKAGEVVSILQRNLRRASDYTPTQREIDLAVNTILTAELLGSQSVSDLAMGAALDELYGFGYDFRSKLAARYGKITPEDVHRVARKYLAGDWVTVVTTPKPEAVQAAKDSE